MYWCSSFLRPCLLLSILACVARVVAQRPADMSVTYQCESCTPSEALQAVSRMSGVNIVYSDRLFQDCKRNRYVFSSVPLRQAVKEIAACIPVELKEIGNTLALSRRDTRVTVNGYVRDAETGELLIGAALYFVGNSKSGAMSNEFGFFSTVLEEGIYTCKVSYTGYQSRYVNVHANSSQMMHISLVVSAPLPEVLVKALPGDADKMGVHLDKLHDLPLENLQLQPMPGGESDLIRLVAMETGVQTGVDGLGGLHVRGGNADQNLFLLDDVPVYNPGHSLGLFSIFNPATVSQARLWKGDAPARYGGRVSSVLDVRTRDGDLHAYHAQATAGLFAATATVEGPLVRNKSAILLSGRGTYFQPWVHLLSEKDNLITFSGDQVVYRFYDLNFKWNYIFSDRDRLYFSFYKGGDVYADELEQLNSSTEGVIDEQYGISTNWGNTIAALRWNHLFGAKLFSNTIFRYSTFNYQSKQNFRAEFISPAGKKSVLYDYGELYQTVIRDWSVKSDFTWYPANNTTLRWGGALTHHEFRPGTLSINYLQPGQSGSNADSLAFSLLNNQRLYALDAETYIDLEWQFAARWRLETGLRGVAFRQATAFYPSIQPGVRVVWSHEPGWRWWGGYHRNVQNLHQIGTYNISLPYELWVPSTSKVRPELVGQLTTGIGLSRKPFSVSVEFFDKRFDRVLTYLSTGGALFNGVSEDASGWEDRVTEGVGRSYGLEVNLSYQTRRTGFQVAYTLSKTTRQFDDVNSGRSFPFRYDRRHSLSIGGRQQILPWLTANVNWVFATGYPITLTGVKYRQETLSGSPSRDVYVYTEVNGYRLPAYHRLDAGLVANFGSKKIEHHIQLGVYNAYNRANPFYLYVDANTGIQGKAVQYTLLPLLPVVQYSIKI